MKKATPDNAALLVEMMAEFYSESPFTLNKQRAAQAFAPLLADERLGWVWLIEAGGQTAGYLVLTLCHSMEYGGLVAVLEDFYVRRAFRNAGLGGAALAEARSLCASRGIRALRLEANGKALGVYRRAGFTPTDRLLMTLELAPPTHAA